MEHARKDRRGNCPILAQGRDVSDARESLAPVVQGLDYLVDRFRERAEGVFRRTHRAVDPIHDLESVRVVQFHDLDREGLASGALADVDCRGCDLRIVELRADAREERKDLIHAGIVRRRRELVHRPVSSRGYDPQNARHTRK